MMRDEEADDLHEGGGPLLAHRTQHATSLGKQAHKRIGTHLRAMYDSVVQQPIPDRFRDLIAKLDDVPAEPTIDDA